MGPLKLTPAEIRQKIVRRERWIKLTILSFILATSLAVLLAIPGMLSSLLLAVVITYLFKPIVSYFERLGMNRPLAVAIPFLISGIIISEVVHVVTPHFNQTIGSLETELPKYSKTVSDLIDRNTRTLTKAMAHFPKMDIADKASSWIQAKGSTLLNDVPDLLKQLFMVMLLAPIIAFFMLRDGRKLNHGLLGFVPNNFFEVSMNLLYQINQQLGAFIRARLLESVIVGTLVWLGMWAFDVPYAFLLAAVAGVTNLIPYIGPVVGAIPGLVVAASKGINLFPVGAVYVAAQIIDMAFVIPLVVAKIVDLHPVTVIISILVGAQLLGVLGAVISVPVASIIKLTFTEFYNHVVDFRR